MTTNKKEQKQIINNILDYYHNGSITKYNVIDLIIATLNNKIDKTKSVIDNLEQIKK